MAMAACLASELGADIVYVGSLPVNAPTVLLDPPKHDWSELLDLTLAELWAAVEQEVFTSHFNRSTMLQLKQQQQQQVQQQQPQQQERRQPRGGQQWFKPTNWRAEQRQRQQVDLRTTEQQLTPEQDWQQLIEGNGLGIPSVDGPSAPPSIRPQPTTYVPYTMDPARTLPLQKDERPIWCNACQFNVQPKDLMDHMTGPMHYHHACYLMQWVTGMNPNRGEAYCGACDRWLPGGSEFFEHLKIHIDEARIIPGEPLPPTVKANAPAPQSPALQSGQQPRRPKRQIQ